MAKHKSDTTTETETEAVEGAPPAAEETATPEVADHVEAFESANKAFKAIKHLAGPTRAAAVAHLKILIPALA